MSGAALQTTAAAPPPSAKTGRPKRTYNCRHCDAVFKRGEHLARHERAHTSDKPFACSFCGASFSRKDLVTRHERTLHDKPRTVKKRAQRSVKGTRNGPQEEQSERGYSTGAADDGACEDSTDNQETASNDSPSQSNQQAFSETHLVELPQQNSISATDMPQHQPELQQHQHEHQQHHSAGAPQYGYNQNAREFGFPRPYHPQDGTSPGEQQELSRYPDPPLISVFGTDFPGIAPWTSSECMGIMCGFDPNALPLSDDGGMLSPLSMSAAGSPVGLAMQHQQGYDGRVLYGRDGCPNVAAAHRVGSFGLQTPSVSVASSGEPNKRMRVRSTAAAVLARPEVDSATQELMFVGIKAKYPEELLKGLVLPNRDTLRRLLATYFTAFHQHLPIIHSPSFDLGTSPAPVTLAMLSIGALYSLERKRARTLRDWAKKLVDYASTKEMQPSQNDMLWIVQTRLLCACFGAWSDDPALKEGAILEQAIVVNYFRATTTSHHGSLLSDTEPSDWNTWIQRETAKRIRYGIFVFGSLLNITFSCPVSTLVSDLGGELPCAEELWEAAPGEEWVEIAARYHHTFSYQSCIDHILLAKPLTLPPDCPLPAFGALTLMHGVLSQLWISGQCSAMMWGREQSGQELSRLAEGILGRCEKMLFHGRHESELKPSSPGSPLPFNIVSLLRLAHLRHFAHDFGFPSKSLLHAHDPVYVAGAMAAFVAQPLVRYPELIKLIRTVYEVLHEPIKVGYVLVRRTAALHWGIEHCLTGWCGILLLAKWTHTVETQPPLDAAESEVLRDIRNLLQDVDIEIADDASVAKEIVLLWSTLMDDTWVWGITPCMGAALRVLAGHFDASKKRALSRGQ